MSSKEVVNLLLLFISLIYGREDIFMKNKTKKIFNLIYGRTLMVIILLVIQVAILVGGFIWLSDDLAYIYSVFNFCSHLFCFF